jgi:spore maturation protein CgeB
MEELSPRDLRMEVNLAALASTQRSVAERLCRAVVDDHLQAGDDGRFTLRHHNRTLPLDLDRHERARLCATAEPGLPVLLFGAGDPALVADLLEAGHRVTLWDRDLALIRHVLYGIDVQAALLSGHLTIRMGVDILDCIERRDALQLIVHPVAATIYKTELLLWETGVPAKLACVCTGGLFVHDLSDALRDQGYGVVPLELVRVSKDEVDHTVARARPAVIVGINYVKGIEGLAVRHGVPVACWEIDPTTDRILPPQEDTSGFHLFTYRERQVSSFGAAGFENVSYLPLAANVHRRRPRVLNAAEQEQYAVPVAHVGSSMGAQAARFEVAYLAAYTAWRGGGDEATSEGRSLMESILATQAQDPSHYCVDALMAEKLGDFMAAMTERRPELDTTYWLAEMAARDKRLDVMRRLASFGAHVWGDPGWKALEQEGVSYRGRAAHGSELTKIYSGARVQIDIGRIYQSDIITMRVFDVLACGGFLLAEWSEALAQAFEIGVEIEAWTTLEELETKAQYYLDHPVKREAIAQRGLRAVRDRHRIRQRVATILEGAIT